MKPGWTEDEARMIKKIQQTQSSFCLAGNMVPERQDLPGCRVIHDNACWKKHKTQLLFFSGPSFKDWITVTNVLRCESSCKCKLLNIPFIIRDRPLRLSPKKCQSYCCVSADWKLPDVYIEALGFLMKPEQRRCSWWFLWLRLGGRWIHDILVYHSRFA
jgi:hypothetical protein